MQNCDSVVAGSFRDPSGFVFLRDDLVYRQINLSYKENYDFFIDSGLCRVLSEAGLIITSRQVDILPPIPEIAYKVIAPDPVPFISYPYEWCFRQLKDAALALLKIQKMALDFGMTLKDASAYNLQYVGGRFVLIDTLSFDKYRLGQCWDGYRQFCQHFLAPLALMSAVDVSLNQLLRIHLGGIPLEMASHLLPLGTKFNFFLFSHIHCHAFFQKKYEVHSRKPRSGAVSGLGLRALIDNLTVGIQRLQWKPVSTAWLSYYDTCGYSVAASAHKDEVVSAFLAHIRPELLIDCAANTGAYSRIAARMGIQTVAFDNDYSAVEKNYVLCVRNKETKIIPLVMDIANPSPGIGWDNQERMPFFSRGREDTMLALALLHHLVISCNLPVEIIADFFHRHCLFLIIEFVPFSDPNAQRLLEGRREGATHSYTQSSFESAFGRYFRPEKIVPLKDSLRVLYLYKRL